ncbi:AI-2E family transporter [Aquincola sp. MAHUQ-54]|uniref:AI-2E family transporter n=1 Tax=Aquincola agrisoli TaxID=3119538 RepID=A0AAW9QGW9_9BURK
MKPVDPPWSALTERPRSSVAAATIATLAVIAVLWWGQRFMIPVVAGVLLAMLLLPAVGALARLLRSQAAAAALSLVLTLALLGAAVGAFGGQLLRMAERVPEMISLAAYRVAEMEPASNTLFSRARNALRELDRAANRAMGAAPPAANTAPRPTRTRPAPAAAASSAEAAASSPALSDRATAALQETAVSGSGVVLEFVADLVIIFFTAFFVLAGGRRLRLRVVDLWGHRPATRRRVEIGMLECAQQVRRYVVVLMITNVLTGVAIWIAFAAAGLPDAGSWGVTAGVLHMVPYLGMALMTGLAGAEAFLAHGTWTAMFGMAAFVVVLSTVLGMLVTAWLQGRAAKMNPAAVFIGLVFWGALWGVWGLFLGPVLVALLKTVAGHTRCGMRLAHLLKG